MKKIFIFGFVFLVLHTPEIFSGQTPSHENKESWAEQLLQSAEKAEKEPVSVEMDYEIECHDQTALGLDRCRKESQNKAQETAAEKGKSIFIESLHQEALKSCGYTEEVFRTYVRIQHTKDAPEFTDSGYSDKGGHTYYRCKIRMVLKAGLSEDFKKNLREKTAASNDKKRIGDPGSEEEAEPEKQNATETAVREQIISFPSYGGMQMAFVRVPVSEDTFEMGCGKWADNCSSDEQVHKVQIREFWIGKSEVTKKQWNLVITNGIHSGDKSEEKLPADNVSWYEVQSFVQKLSADSKEFVFDFPTEAEWEYACRSGGKPENYSGGMEPDKAGWHLNNGKKIHPVGERMPNHLGIFDMSGNVREWTKDWYIPDVTKAVRGGGYMSHTKYLRCSAREQYDPKSRKYGLGVRIIMRKKP